VATALIHYLDVVRDCLRLDVSSEQEVIHELETHIEDKLQELKEDGLSEEEAANACVRFLGSAKSVACQIYEAHSQGTWRQALLASTPHLLFGLLFALNWWQGVGWLLGVVALILSMAVYGWWRGKPAWLFPWLGYCLLPVVAAGLLLLYLPRGWSWLAILIYVPLALWLLYSVTVQTIRRDWLYSSLMLLPVPIIAGWVLAAEPVDGFPEQWLGRVHNFAPLIAMSFLALGVAVVTFVRLRQRWLKLSVLVASGLITITMVAYYADGRISLPAFLALIVIMLNLLLIPAFLERRLRHSGQRPAV
jgi:hypothetical protein